jgi:hypothetical protein
VDSSGAPAEMRRRSQEKLRGGEALDDLHGAAAKRLRSSRLVGNLPLAVVRFRPTIGPTEVEPLEYGLDQILAAIQDMPESLITATSGHGENRVLSVPKRPNILRGKTLSRPMLRALRLCRNLQILDVSSIHSSPSQYYPSHGSGSPSLLARSRICR